jgi:peroxiredoxin
MPQTRQSVPEAPQVGAAAPDFSLPVTGGGAFTLSQRFREGPVVVAFFPFAFSSTCTDELCTFTDDVEAYAEHGATVVGVSCDARYTLEAYAKAHGIRVPLASDFDKRTAKAYGVLNPDHKGLGATARRSVFVVDPGGLVRYAWTTQDADDEPPYEEVLEAVARLSGG